MAEGQGPLAGAKRLSGFVWRLLVRADAHNITVYAGHVAYTGFLAMFPFLAFLASIAGFLGSIALANKMIDFAFAFVSPSVAKVLSPAVKQVMKQHQGGLLTISAIGTIWVASSGIEALRSSINRAYQAEEQRPYWLRRLQSAFYVVTAALILLTIAIIVLTGPAIWDVLHRTAGVGKAAELPFVLLRYALGIVVITVTSSVLYRQLASISQSWRATLPGSVLTALLWNGFAAAFVFYFGHVADFSVTYGSLGGVAITLVFFYLSAAIFIFGAELNSVLGGQRGQNAER